MILRHRWLFRLVPFLLVAAYLPATAFATVVYDQSGLYSPHTSDSRLTIYVYPPSRALHWASPKAALWSFLDSGLSEVVGELTGRKHFRNDFGEKESFPYGYRSTMGHTIVHIQCRLPGDEGGGVFDRWASLSGQEFQEVDRRNVQGAIGLEVLFYNYLDGFIIAGQENRERLSFYTGEREIDGKLTAIHPRYLSFNIDEAACVRVRDMEQHFETYHYPATTPFEALLRKKRYQHLYFTTNMDPYASYHEHLQNEHALEGGGCAPFGVSMMREAGVLVDDHANLDPMLKDAWQLKLEISERLIGNTVDEFGNERRDLHGQPRHVSDLSLLLKSIGDRWTYDGVPNREFANFDPQHIWDFVGEVRVCLQSGGGGCTPVASRFVSRRNPYLRGRRVGLGEDERFEDRRPGKSPLEYLDFQLFAPGPQPLQNLVEGIQIDQ